MQAVIFQRVFSQPHQDVFNKNFCTFVFVVIKKPFCAAHLKTAYFTSPFFLAHQENLLLQSRKYYIIDLYENQTMRFAKAR
jgi:hypothetical protein